MADPKGIITIDAAKFFREARVMNGKVTVRAAYLAELLDGQGKSQGSGSAKSHKKHDPKMEKALTDMLAKALSKVRET